MERSSASIEDEYFAADVRYETTRRRSAGLLPKENRIEESASSTDVIESPTHLEDATGGRLIFSRWSPGCK
jgi:hypothetical protein